MRTYSDAALTTEATGFSPGDTIYFEHSITALFGTTDSTVSVEVYDHATDSLQDTPLDTTYSLAANTATTLSTINGAAVVSWASGVGQTPGMYYAVLTFGSQTLTQDFEIENVPASSILYSTTEEFDAGTYSNCMAETDNLYGGLYEDFADESLSSAFTALNSGGSWVYSNKDARISGNYVALIRADDYFSFSNLAFAAQTGRWVYISPNNWVIAIIDKSSAPDLTNIGSLLVGFRTYSNDGTKLYAIYIDTEGTAHYWKQSTSEWTTSAVYSTINTMASNSYRCEIECSALQFRMNAYDTSNNLVMQSSWVDKSSVYTNTGKHWLIFGGTVANGTYTPIVDDIKLSLISGATWTSPSITPPTDQQLKNLTFTLTNGSATNCIDRVEILDASNDSVIDTASGDITSSGSIVWTDFVNRLIPTFNVAFKIKLYFKSGGSSILTISEITGDFEYLTRVRFDGEAFAA